METGNRLGPVPGGGGRHDRVLRLLVRAASCVALAGLLAACQTPAGDASMAAEAGQ